jgi:hypothetical protein
MQRERLDNSAASRPDRNPFLTTAEAGHLLHLTVRTLERLRRNGAGPAYRRHGRYIFYHIDDLMDWSRSTRKGKRGA